MMVTASVRACAEANSRPDRAELTLIAETLIRVNVPST